MIAEFDAKQAPGSLLHALQDAANLVARLPEALCQCLLAHRFFPTILGYGSREEGIIVCSLFDFAPLPQFFTHGLNYRPSESTIERLLWRLSGSRFVSAIALRGQSIKGQNFSFKLFLASHPLWAGPIGKEAPQIHAQESPETPPLRIGPTNPVTLQKMQEELLREILGFCGRQAGGAEETEDRFPIEACEAIQRRWAFGMRQSLATSVGETLLHVPPPTAEAKQPLATFVAKLC